MEHCVKQPKNVDLLVLDWLMRIMMSVIIDVLAHDIIIRISFSQESTNVHRL